VTRPSAVTGRSVPSAGGIRIRQNRRVPESGKVMDDSDDFTQLDDFQVIAERRRVAAMLAALTDRYRQLNQEMNRRVTLQWMVP
jgi:hypothetical protein